MDARPSRVLVRARAGLRRALWWIWPDLPSSWREVPARLQPAAVQVGRLTVAAVVAYLVANLVSPGLLDLTAPLTALLVVQASTVSTLLMGLVRVGAVLTGVLVAVGLASAIGLSWWSLAIVIASSLLLAKLLRLGEQSLEAPISAMLILAVSTPGLAAEVRVVNTLIGTFVGVAFSLLVPVAIPNATASDAVRRVARSQAALLSEIAAALGDRAPHPEEAQAWLDWTVHLRGELQDAALAVRRIEESRRLNARALAVANAHPGLQDALGRLDRCLAAERAIVVVLEQEAVDVVGPDGPSTELRRVFAVLLEDLATGLRSFGDAVGGAWGGSASGVDEAIARTQESGREARAVLTELALLDIDPRASTELWMVQGSVLTAVEQMLRQLDLEHGVWAPDALSAVRTPPLRRVRPRLLRRRSRDGRT